MRSRAPGELAGAGSTVRKEMTSHWWEFFFGGKLCGSPLGESSGTPKRHSGWTAPPHDSCPETQDPPPGDCVGLFFRLIDVFVFGRLVFVALHGLPPVERGLLFTEVCGLLVTWRLGAGQWHTRFSSCSTEAQRLWLASPRALCFRDPCRTRTRTHVPGTGRLIVIHYAAGEVLQGSLFT